MKLVMTLLVRDEADIVGDMLDFHLRAGVDHVVAMDNASVDGTTETLREFTRGNWLTLLHESSSAYRQDKWQSHLGLVARHLRQADWIIFSDADEFWIPPEGQTLKYAIETAGASGADMLSCDRVNLLGAEGEEPWQDRLVYRPANPKPLHWPDPLRDPIEDPFFYYSMSNKVICRAQNFLHVGRGAHTAIFEHPSKSAHCSVAVRHVPVRNKNEFARSVGHIGEAVRADSSLDLRVSAKYRRWSIMTERTGSIDAAWKEAMPSTGRLGMDIEKGVLVRDDRLKNMLRRRVRQTSAPSVAMRSKPVGSDRPLATMALLAGLHQDHVRSIAEHLGAKDREEESKVWRPADLALFHRQNALDFGRDRHLDPTQRRAQLLAHLLGLLSDNSPIVLAPPESIKGLPLWRELQSEAELDLRVAIVYVDPVRAAEELGDASDMPHALGMMAWLRAMVQAERETRGLRRAFFALPPQGTKLGTFAERIRRSLNLEIDSIPSDDGAWVRPVATRPEIHASKRIPETCKALLVGLDALSRCDNDEAFQDNFDKIDAQTSALDEALDSSLI